MSFTLVLPVEYSYVIFTFIASIFVLQYLGFMVGGARKKYDVQYPTMYDNAKPEFNCVQRGHQNFLEGYTYFIILLFIAGLKSPVVASIAGLIHLVGRIVYAHGYATGKPEKRVQGAIFIYPSLFTLLGYSIWFGITLMNSH